MARALFRQGHFFSLKPMCLYHIFPSCSMSITYPPPSRSPRPLNVRFCIRKTGQDFYCSGWLRRGELKSWPPDRHETAISIYTRARKFKLSFPPRPRERPSHALRTGNPCLAGSFRFHNLPAIAFKVTKSQTASWNAPDMPGQCHNKMPAFWDRYQVAN